MDSAQRKYTVIQLAGPAKPNTPLGRVVSSRQIERKYKQSTRGPKLTKAEQLQEEWRQQARIRQEFEEERRQARQRDRALAQKQAQTLRDKQKLKDQASLEEKRRLGIPVVACRPSQDTLTRFMHGNGTGKKRTSDGDATEPCLPQAVVQETFAFDEEDGWDASCFDFDNALSAQADLTIPPPEIMEDESVQRGNEEDSWRGRDGVTVSIFGNYAAAPIDLDQPIEKPSISYHDELVWTPSHDQKAAVYRDPPPAGRQADLHKIRCPQIIAQTPTSSRQPLAPLSTQANASRSNASPVSTVRRGGAACQNVQQQRPVPDVMQSVIDFSDIEFDDDVFAGIAVRSPERAAPKPGLANGPTRRPEIPPPPARVQEVVPLQPLPTGELRSPCIWTDSRAGSARPALGKVAGRVLSSRDRGPNSRKIIAQILAHPFPDFDEAILKNPVRPLPTHDTPVAAPTSDAPPDVYFHELSTRLCPTPTPVSSNGPDRTRGGANPSRQSQPASNARGRPSRGSSRPQTGPDRGSRGRKSVPRESGIPSRGRGVVGRERASRRGVRGAKRGARGGASSFSQNLSPADGYDRPAFALPPPSPHGFLLEDFDDIFAPSDGLQPASQDARPLPPVRDNGSPFSLRHPDSDSLRLDQFERMARRQQQVICISSSPRRDDARIAPITRTNIPEARQGGRPTAVAVDEISLGSWSDDDVINLCD